MKPATILLAEDDATLLFGVGEWLVEMGYRVIQASTGAAALQTLRSPEVVDAIVSDVKMPEMDGLELAALAQQLRPGTPMILMTGFPGAVDEALQHGRLALMKPFTREALQRLLDEALNPIAPREAA